MGTQGKLRVLIADDSIGVEVMAVYIVIECLENGKLFETSDWSENVVMVV